MSDLLELKVPGKPQYVGTVRMTVASIASGLGFDIESIDDIKVAVSEACTNIVCHSDMEQDFVYDVSLQIEDERLVIIVQDYGKGYNVEEKIKKEAICEEFEGGGDGGLGLGLFIIKALMDEVDVKSEIGVGTYIQMTKYLKTNTVA